MARRRPTEEAPAGAPLWMTTFADMTTLLLCFFVMLLSFSTIQEAKFHDAIRSLKEAFGVLQSPPTVIDQPTVIQPRAHQDEIEELIDTVQEIAAALDEQGLRDAVTLSVDAGGVTIRVSTPFLFASARAELRRESLPVLDRLAASLARIPQPVRVQGHTDNLPIATEEFPSNWELAAGRALTILRYFEGKGIPSSRLSAVSYGEHHPVADNGTPEGRARNRRVELFVELEDGAGRQVMTELVPAKE